MNTGNVTCHASARMQQRGITGEVVELLQQFGRRRHDHHNGVVLFFDKRAKERIAKALGKAAAQLNLNAYAVECADAARLITVGHRVRRFREAA